MPFRRTKDTGRRLITTLIDEIAKENPNRVWACIPKDDSDLSKGFRDVIYREFSNAINHAAHWLKDSFNDEVVSRKTIAYSGPKDLRHPILAVAASKCGMTLLLPSPFASPAAIHNLLDLTACTTYLHARDLGRSIRSIIELRPNVKTWEVPDLNTWLFSEEAPAFQYTKTWETAKSEPWLIFHTSGTTGLPKPVVYTNMMMTSFDAAELMPDTDGETMNDLFRDQRFYVSLPLLHFVGMTAALQMTVFLGIVLIVGPLGQPSVSQIIDILDYGKAVGVIMPPSQIEAVCNDSKGCKIMKGLDCVYFGGAPVSRHVAQKLVGHTKLFPAMGTTEAGAYFLEVRNDGEDWEYYRFRPSMGVELRQRSEGLYELVFVRQPELERWQQFFMLYPDRTDFPTADLWEPHPSKEGLWKYSGRLDDLIVLSHGEGIYTSKIEKEIQELPGIKHAIMGGSGKQRPFLLIDLAEHSSLIEQAAEARLAELWPHVERAIKDCSEHVRLTRQRVIFTDPVRPLPLTAKESVQKKSAFVLYEPEIERVYLEQASSRLRLLSQPKAVLVAKTDFLT
ncbi:hypothetical protein MMC25_007652 [Agyrium rufum]|nr:hypothetical protein [Agyrium rufum]